MGYSSTDAKADTGLPPVATRGGPGEPPRRPARSIGGRPIADKPGPASLAALPPGTCLLACSGGHDSTGLLALLAARGASLVIGHVAHGWRSPQEEARDLRAVRECGRRLGIAVHRVRAAPSRSEGAARTARYRALRALAGEVGAAAIATAHHRDDQLESVLLALLRGSGPRGLRGIAARRPLAGLPLVRPALALPRTALVAAIGGLPVSEDASNRSRIPRRNFLRHVVLPGLGEPSRRALWRLRAAAAAWVEAAERALPPPQRGRLPAEAAGWPLLLLGEAARGALPEVPLDLAAVRRLRQVARRRSRACELPGGGQAAPAGDGVALWAGAAPSCPDGELPVPGTLALGACGRLEARPATGPGKARGLEVCVAGRGPLRVRAWRPGDALRPPGTGTRKLRHLLREAGVPAGWRGAVPVVCDAEGVLWLAGSCLAARALPRAEERSTLIRWEPGDFAASFF